MKSQQWWRRIYKNSKGKSMPMILLQIRTLSSAVEVIDWVSEIPFEKLSMSLYFYCQDVGMKEFTRAYESQMELAAANPEKFALGLHKFFSEMARKIQKEDLYDLYFEFYYRCVKRRLRNEDEKISETVTTAYQNLLIQQLEYLRPNKYDLKSFVAGRKTTGELITREDPFPTFDIPIFQIRSELEQGRKFSNAEKHLYELYRKQGYEIYNEEDQHRIIAQDKIHTTTCSMLLPFINEYTFDILPQTTYNANSDIIHLIHPNMLSSVLKDDLRRRKRTLPTNGAKIKFSGTKVLHELLLKEILYDGSIYMLYRLRTANGDLSGVYETRDQFFYTVFQGSLGHEYLASGIETLVLFCYASLVIGNRYLLTNIHDAVSVLDCEKLEASGFGQGGKLRNVYDRVEARRTGEYEAGEASIHGYIRRLPEGQTASRDAAELAESLGYELEANETYVRPFLRQVFRLKERVDEKSLSFKPQVE